MKRLLFLWLWVPLFVYAQTGSVNVSVIRSKVTDSTTVVEPSGYKNLWYSNQSGYWTYTDASGRHRLIPGIADGDKGDITVSGSGGTWTIDNTVVTYAKFQDVAGLSLVGRASNSSGVTAAITAGSDYNILRRSGTSIGFGSIDLSQSGAVGSSILAVGNGGTGASSFPGWLLASGGTLTGANEIVGSTTNTFKFRANSIGTSTTNLTFLLANDTDAGAGAQQFSPIFWLRARGWKTNATAASQTVDYGIQAIAVQGTANPTGGLRIYESINGGASTFMTITPLGVTGASSSAVSFASGGAAGWLRVNTSTVVATFQQNGGGGGLEINGGSLFLNAVISPAQITSNQTDYAPSGLSTAGVLRLSSDASRTINSLTGGVTGRILVLVNIGTQNIILLDDDGSTGTAANRFQLSSNYTLVPEHAVSIWYDGTSSRWRIQSNTTFTSTLPGLVPSSGGGSTNFLRADGTWAAPSGGISGTLGTVDNAATRADGTGGSTAQGSDLLISDAADLTLGITTSTTGTTRTILAAGTSSNIVLALSSKGSSSVSITSNSNTWLISGANVYNNTGVSNFAGDDDGVFLKSFDASGVTGDVTVSTGSSSTNNSGNIFLSIGSASGTRGNLSIFDSTGSFGSGQRVIFIADRTAAPSGTPSGGGILYVESGALKFKGSSGTVTTVAVP